MNQNRLLDANINRSAEGLRVLEDIARFSLDNQKLSAAIRSLRHRVRELFKGREHSLLSARDSAADVGQITSQQAAGSDERDGLRDTVLSNFKRVQEASRSIEEIL
ncbi:MAG: thiamine phosphate synthase, partial [Candidatus Electrothrix sp. EH2]|nr:thiamine phosphate synthase [Candidatus Electrothrix sp. EH2]